MSGPPPGYPSLPYPVNPLHPSYNPDNPMNPYQPPNQGTVPFDHSNPASLSYPNLEGSDERGPPPPPGFVDQNLQLTYPPHPAVCFPAPCWDVNGPPPSQDGNKDEEHHPGDYSGLKVGYRWVPASSSACDVPGALLVGHDQDGTAIYAGRAYHQGDMLPAKVIPAKNVAYVAYGGEEVIKDQFEVFVTETAPEAEDDSCWCCFCCGGSEILTPYTLNWVWAQGGNIPDGAVQVGQTAEGEPLYLGRVNRDGALTPGKIQRSHGCCYFPFDGEEKSSCDYEVLVQQ